MALDCTYYKEEQIKDAIADLITAVDMGNENLTKRDMDFLDETLDQYDNTGDLNDEQLHVIFEILRKVQ